MDSFPCLRNGSICFGRTSLSITGATLDTLVEDFGEPEKQEILGSDSRIRLYHFSHSWGRLIFFMKFKDGDLYYPPVIDAEYWNTDRGSLVEIQLELDEPMPLKRLGMPRTKGLQGKYHFALYRKHFLARLINNETFDALSFFNILHIPKAQDTFLFRLFPWHNIDVPVCLAVAKKVAELRESENITNKKAKEFLDKEKSNPAKN